MPWNPDQYHRFQAERFAPFSDLLALITVRPLMDVVDLGSGTGELTARLTAALPGSRVLGIDSSAEMLARAERLQRPGLRFVLRSIEEVDGRFDLIFSHAALQWVPDHHTLFPRLLSLLRPGGQLAVQMPSNHYHPVHRLITDVAAEPPFRPVLQGFVRHSPVLAIEEYAEMLFAAGGENITVIEKVYPHVLPNAAAVLQWVRGTALVPYLERLPADMVEPFLSHLYGHLEEMYPQNPVFYGFRRILLSALFPG